MKKLSVVVVFIFAVTITAICSSAKAGGTVPTYELCYHRADKPIVRVCSKQSQDKALLERLAAQYNKIQKQLIYYVQPV